MKTKNSRFQLEWWHIIIIIVASIGYLYYFGDDWKISAESLGLIVSLFFLLIFAKIVQDREN